MASSNQLTTRTMHQLAKSAPRRGLPQASHIQCRPYHRLLQDNIHPPRLMQGFHTSLPSPAPAPPIDSFTFPQSYTPPTASSDILRIPLLPTNSFTAHAEAIADEVSKPEIYTVSADSTHIAKPSLMSNEKDGHHGVVEGFDMAGSMERGVETVKEVGGREAGVVREFWEGMLDDVLGKKKVGGA